MVTLQIELPDFIVDGLQQRCKMLKMDESKAIEISIRHSLLNEGNFFELYHKFTNPDD